MDKPIMITKMIQEELDNISNEVNQSKNQTFNFTQRLNNSLFYNFHTFTNDFEVDVTQSDIIINWDISFWMNKSGIENFIINSDNWSVNGVYLLQLYDKQSDELKQESQKNIQDIKWKFGIEDDLNAGIMVNGSFYISQLTFDFENQNCYVSFSKQE